MQEAVAGLVHCTDVGSTGERRIQLLGGLIMALGTQLFCELTGAGGWSLLIVAHRLIVPWFRPQVCPLLTARSSGAVVGASLMTAPATAAALAR
jgi:hypothetical protein